MALRTANVWAHELVVERNRVRQLLVPDGRVSVVEDVALRIGNVYGEWAARRGGAASADGPLTARLSPLGVDTGRVEWVGARTMTGPEVVTESYRGAIGFRDPGEAHSLRRPQVGALYSVLGYWASGLDEPGVVVMPTGTGKTETMLAVMVAARPRRVLVLVPTSALRDQVAAKFETLGILQKLQIVTPTAFRPCVGKMEHVFKEPLDAVRFAEACNVVVATPQVLYACSDDVRNALFPCFTHLMVDEAHHAPAPTWSSVIDKFADRPVLLFTATPFREDGKAIPGRTVFRFPLREAQKEGYFVKIDYRAVISLDDTDEVLADLALGRLRTDLEAGYDHILMARANTVARAKRVLEIYQRKAADLGPAILYDKVAPAIRREVLTAMHTRRCRVIVCVDMLGEGFDLPALKVAALHDTKKSLSPMIQLIGRFARSQSTASRIGDASAFVVRDPTVAMSPLRELLREDADWNLLLRDITERANRAAEEISAFDASFTGGPEDVSTPSLAPKMSAVAHRAPIPAWNPEAALEFYGLENVLDGAVAVSGDSAMAWFIVEHRDNVPWADIRTLPQVGYELIVMYFDARNRLLYIHSSEKKGDYAELATAVLGDGTTTIKGTATFRVLAEIDRLIPTNIGLLDSRDHFRRFSMHVGSDVLQALEIADQQNKSQTHIATSGLNNGETVSICAALSGRFWSMNTAPSLKVWKDWCDVQGRKLLDTTIDLKKVLAGFIIPKDITERPEHVLLGAEWPWRFYAGSGTQISLELDGQVYPLTDVEFIVNDFATTGPFMLSLDTPTWRIAYRADFENGVLLYSPIDKDAGAKSRLHTVPLQEWINMNKPTLFLDGDRIITGDDRLHEPRIDLPPFDPNRLVALDWQGTDITAESQKAERRQDSIQAKMSAYLQETTNFDVLLDDDGSGEAADLVGFQVVGTELHITLVHCKYSSKPTGGARVVDLYELCGQAIRGAKWRQQGAQPLLRNLDRRTRLYSARTGGGTPYEVGGIRDLHNLIEIAPQLVPVFHTVLVQPGLSVKAVKDDHLRLLAGAESYVRAVAKGTFEVYSAA